MTSKQTNQQLFSLSQDPDSLLKSFDKYSDRLTGLSRAELMQVLDSITVCVEHS